MTAWHPVALSADIPARTAAPIRLRGQEIALWRDTAGRLAAWEDRCPHRGMRLSFGFVRRVGEEDRLACLYHGWQFGADGRCRHVPAHPDMTPPGTIRARTMHVREARGFAWLASPPGAPGAEAGPAPEAAMDAIGDAAGATREIVLPVRSLALAAEAAIVADRLGIGPSAMLRRQGLTLGLHAPCEGMTMLHVGVTDLAGVAHAHSWAMAARDAIEAGRGVAWGRFA